MSGNEPPKGPDLGQWTEVSRLEGATPFAGQVSGEAVIACRAGNDVVAVGASCTHYGGPLGEGLIVGNTVRCPWHHACFDLRTGEPIAAPALFPIARYRVERDGGKFRIAENLPDPPIPKPSAAPRSAPTAAAGPPGFAPPGRPRAPAAGGTGRLADPAPDP